MATMMRKHFDTIDRELNAAMDTVEAGEGDPAVLLERLEALLHNVRGKRFATGHQLFGKNFKPGGEAAEALDGVEPPPREFERGDMVRTNDGYIAYVGHYDHRNRVVANVVYQACEFNETDLKRIEQ